MRTSILHPYLKLRHNFLFFRCFRCDIFYQRFQKEATEVNGVVLSGHTHKTHNYTVPPHLKYFGEYSDLLKIHHWPSNTLLYFPEVRSIQIHAIQVGRKQDTLIQMRRKQDNYENELKEPSNFLVVLPLTLPHIV